MVEVADHRGHEFVIGRVEVVEDGFGHDPAYRVVGTGERQSLPEIADAASLYQGPNPCKARVLLLRNAPR